MGMDVGGSKTGAKSDINVTPLIDVVLVLLIIFMVLTPSMLKHLSANVPRKAPPNAPPPPPDQNPIVVELTKDREVAVNTDPVSWEALPDKVAERLKSHRQKVVFFKIDEEAMYGDAVKLFDMVRGAGAKVLGIVTREEQQ